MGMNRLVLGEYLFQFCDLSHLLESTDTPQTSLLKPHIVEFSADVERLRQECFLFPIRV
jgi:hypothetical protein